MKLTNFEAQVYEILMDNTGWWFTKDSDEDGTFYLLFDSYGDQDGDPIYDFDDLLDFITQNDEIDQALTALV